MFRLIVCLALVTESRSSPQEGAQFLQDTISDLKKHVNMVSNSNRRAIQVATPSPIDRAHTQESVPSLHLTKAELASMYENAISKGETIKLDPGEAGAHINAVVHELDEQNDYKKGDENDAGYYYYYYPLKSFMDELTETKKPDKPKVAEHGKYHQPDYYEHKEVTKPYMHAHTHQHTVQIEPMKNMVDMDKKKGLEPLFMAISGFIGMTIMFILSILVLPKFEKLKPKGFKNEGLEITSITKIVMEAIEGKDCTERLTCEFGKAVHAFNLYNNRFVKLIRRMGPKTFMKQIDQVGKYTDKKIKCAVISCKIEGGSVDQKNKSKTEKL